MFHSKENKQGKENNAKLLNGSHFKTRQPPRHLFWDIGPLLIFIYLCLSLFFCCFLFVDFWTCLRSCVACASGFVFVALFIASSCPLQALFSNPFAHSQVPDSFAQSCQFGLSHALVALGAIAFPVPCHRQNPAFFKSEPSSEFKIQSSLECKSLQDWSFFRAQYYSEPSVL